MYLLYIFLNVTALFFIFLIIKNFSKGKLKENICAICMAVSLTWISLLVLFWLGLFDDKTLIALLMGQSILGVFYLFESLVNENYKIFRFPFLLSLIFFGVIILQLEYAKVNSLIFILVIWVIFFIIYIYRKNKALNSWFNKIIDCCRRW